MHPPARSEHRARREIFFQFVRLERGGHDDQFEIGSLCFLQLQRAREGDVAVEMAFVEFVEENRRDAAQLRILQQLAEENSLSHETDARLFGGDFFETDLVTDLVAEPSATFESDALGEQPRGEAARLQDDDFALAEQSAIEQDLRNLRRFAGTSRRLQDQTRPGGERALTISFSSS